MVTSCSVLCTTAKWLPTIFSGLPLGLLFGALFGPLRLAGVDYSKWYRDPGEPSEGNDHSWIGLMKATGLTSARIILYAFVGGILLVMTVYLVKNGPAVGWPVVGKVIGFVVGAAVIQAIFEGLWCWGLHRGKGQSLQIRLAHPATQPRRPIERRQAKRRLVVCCDGTWNKPASTQIGETASGWRTARKQGDTNVVHLLRAIPPRTRIDGQTVWQISYYHVGVGTGDLLDRFAGGGAGLGLASSVRTCYGFLVDNFQEGDEILLFGFSRGAYVVRSLAGLINHVGLLQKEEMYRFFEAWDYYASPLSPHRCKTVLDKIAPNRRENVEIKCIGVWDTVGALGIPGSKVCAATYAFHDTRLGPHIDYAFQALAMDEQRGNFQPAIWVRASPELRANRDQVLEQVWFPGVHSNIGGGYVQHGLSDSTLLWMLSRLKHYHLLDLDMRAVTEAINRRVAEPPAIGKVQDSRSICWKLVFCPIPRPVGITDNSERIHKTAFLRTPTVRNDPYRTKRRQEWLSTIPPDAIARLSRFEQEHGFAGPGIGKTVKPIRSPRRGFCDWLLRKIFGTA